MRRLLVLLACLTPAACTQAADAVVQDLPDFSTSRANDRGAGGAMLASPPPEELTVGVTVHVVHEADLAARLADGGQAVNPYVPLAVRSHGPVQGFRLIAPDGHAVELDPGQHEVLLPRAGAFAGWQAEVDGPVGHVAAPLPPVAFNAMAVVAGQDGVLWAATTHDGLVGVRRTAAGTVQATVYPGVVTPNLQAPADHEPGPSDAFVVRMAAAPGGALWLGNLAFGLDWFDPGADPWSTADDRWQHALPPKLGKADALQTLVGDTVTALLPEGDDLWVGTLNGLWFLDRDGQDGDIAQATWTRLAPGPVLAIARGPGDTVWAGCAAGVHPHDGADDAPEALLELHTGATVADTADDTLQWRHLGPDQGHVSVLALLVHDGALWLGTNGGLYARPVVAPFDGPLAHWSEGQDGLTDGDVLALAPAGPHALWLGAFSRCNGKGGALMRLDDHGTATDPGDDALMSWSTAEGLHDDNVSALAPLGENRVAFTTFRVDLWGARGVLGVNQVRRENGCKAPPANKDGLTVLDLSGQGPMLLDF